MCCVHFSLKDFVSGASEYAINMVDNLLDILTSGQHSKSIKTIEAEVSFTILYHCSIPLLLVAHLEQNDVRIAEKYIETSVFIYIQIFPLVLARIQKMGAQSWLWKKN